MLVKLKIAEWTCTFAEKLINKYIIVGILVKWKHVEYGSYKMKKKIHFVIWIKINFQVHVAKKYPSNLIFSKVF